MKINKGCNFEGDVVGESISVEDGSNIKMQALTKKEFNTALILKISIILLIIYFVILFSYQLILKSKKKNLNHSYKEKQKELKTRYRLLKDLQTKLKKQKKTEVKKRVLNA